MTSNSKLSLALIFLGSIALSSCSTIQRSDSSEVELNFRDQQSVSESALEVPPELASPNTSELFNNDQQIINRASRILSGENSRNILIKDSEKVSLQRMGPYRWLKIEAPASEVYQYAKNFLTNLGFGLAIDDFAIGLLETDWKENRPKIPAQSLGIVRSALSRAIGQIYTEDKIDRFRIRIEPVNSQTTEIFISHQTMVQKDLAGTNTWVFADSQPELEVELSYRFLVYLGLSMDDARVIASTQPNATNRGANGQNYSENTLGMTYEINESFNRAWLLVGWAIDRSDFVIYDRNRQEGVFYIRMGQRFAETRQGFLDKLMFWKNQVDIESLRVQVRLTENLQKDAVVINILSESGQRLDNNQAELFLNDIVENI